MWRPAVVLGIVAMAVAACSAAAGDGATAALLEGLRDPSGAVRSRAAMQLALRQEQVPGEAVSPLATALADRDLNVRYWAASALKRLGPGAKAAVPELRRALKTFPGGVPELEGPKRYFADVRALAAETLGAIGAPAREALPDLQEAMRDEDASVREAATKAVKAIGP